MKLRAIRSERELKAGFYLRVWMFPDLMLSVRVVEILGRPYTDEKTKWRKTHTRRLRPEIYPGLIRDEHLGDLGVDGRPGYRALLFKFSNKLQVFFAELAKKDPRTILSTLVNHNPNVDVDDILDDKEFQSRMDSYDDDESYLRHAV